MRKASANKPATGERFLFDIWTINMVTVFCAIYALQTFVLKKAKCVTIFGHFKSGFSLAKLFASVLFCKEHFLGVPLITILGSCAILPDFVIGFSDIFE